MARTEELVRPVSRPGAKCRYCDAEADLVEIKLERDKQEVRVIRCRDMLACLGREQEASRGYNR